MAYIGNSPTNIVRGRRAVYEFTAAAGQTVFTGVDNNGLTLDLLEFNENDVYLNGSRLVLNDDYTVSGDTLTLGSSAALNDILVIVTQDEIANAGSYTKAESDSRYINYNGDIVNGDLQVVGNITVDNIFAQTGIIHDGDTDTSIKFIDNRIYMDVNGNRLLDLQNGGVVLDTAGLGSSFGGNVVVAQGKVGVGVTNPDRALHVGSSTYPQIRMVEPGVDTYDIGVTGSLLKIGKAGATTNAIFLNDSGNVGIGDGSPEAKLTIAGGTADNYTDGIVVSKSGGNLYGIYPSLNNLEFRSVTGNTHIMTMTYGGNVGIGNSNPSRGFHVSGKSQFDDVLKFANFTSNPVSPSEGDTYYNSLTKSLNVYNGSSWGTIPVASLGSETNPATSAEQILQYNPSAPDGYYYIQTASGTAYTYCMMSWGGYMLVATIDSTQDVNWAYTGSYWTTSSPINESLLDSNTVNGDAVHRLYYEYKITTGMKFSLNTYNNYLNETAGGGVIGKTAKECFTGSYMASDNGRNNFLALMAAAGTPASNWDNQLYCNHAGFNTIGTAYAIRWGISMNNENDCNSNDSGVGFGGYTNNWYTLNEGVRNANAGGWRWSTDQRFAYSGMIWVK